MRHVFVVKGQLLESFLYYNLSIVENLLHYLKKDIIKLIIRAPTESEIKRLKSLFLFLFCSFRHEGPSPRDKHAFFFGPTANGICITVLCWWSLIDIFSHVQSKLATLQVNFLSTFQWLSPPLKTGIHNERRQFSSQLECLSRLSSPIVLPLPLVRTMNFHEGQTLHFR